jgi:hypothetical protein
VNKKERAQLDSLIDRVARTTSLIHSLPSDCSEICGCKMIAKTPLEKMEALVDHLDAFDIYLKYLRFDREASVRDLDKLLGIIHKLGGKR